MFKERLKIVLGKLGDGLLGLFLALLLIGIVIGMGFLSIKYPVIDKIVMYLFFTIAGLAALFVIGGILLRVYSFIDWLFIEPYKERKKLKS